MILLAPAGNFETLKTAVYNGADEVYLGIDQFNARNNIDGFTIDGLKEAVDFAHLYNVKVMLAINILFSDDEIQSALDLIVDAYNLGVDAFIVQDIGLINVLFCNYPEITIHASTQMGVHNLEGVRVLERLGVKRVVLSRETPLLEIKRIKANSNIEIEYFVQGALCVSFSGNCYLSSYLFNASGNRGVCKQLCRLPYTLYNGKNAIKKGFLLSAKDFNLIDRLNDLKDAGVDVLKIEGRARRPSYVGLTVREYRSALDGDKYSHDNLSLAFNRNFTAGYFDGNSNIISDIQNHVGLKVGEVEKVNYGKKFNEMIISSNREISPKSTIKLFDGNIEKNTITAFDVKKISFNKFLITTTQDVAVGLTVRLILDEVLEREILSITKKIPIKIAIDFQKDLPAKISCSYGNESFTIDGEILYPAKNQPISKEEVEFNFSKSEIFTPEIEFIKFDNVFIQKQKLNQLRRDFYDKLKSIISSKYYKNLNKIVLTKPKNPSCFDNFVFVDNYENLPPANNVIYSPESYVVDDINNFIFICKKQGKIPFLDLPNFATEGDVNILNDIVQKTNISIVVNNLYALDFPVKKIIGPALNIFNSYSANFYNLPFISAESKDFNKVNYPYMTLRHCPIKEHVGGDCRRCLFDNNYKFKTNDGKELKLKRKKLSSCTFYLI